MPAPEFDGDMTTTAEVAEHVLEEFAAKNSGVARVIPVEEVETQLEAVVQNRDAFDESEWEALLVEVKDEVLERDVVIA